MSIPLWEIKPLKHRDFNNELKDTQLVNGSRIYVLQINCITYNTSNKYVLPLVTYNTYNKYILRINYSHLPLSLSEVS